MRFLAWSPCGRWLMMSVYVVRLLSQHIDYTLWEDSDDVTYTPEIKSSTVYIYDTEKRGITSSLVLHARDQVEVWRVACSPCASKLAVAYGTYVAIFNGGSLLGADAGAKGELVDEEGECELVDTEEEEEEEKTKKRNCAGEGEEEGEKEGKNAFPSGCFLSACQERPEDSSESHGAD